MQRIFMCIVATVLTLVWAVLSMMKGEEFDEMIDSVDSNEFYFPQLLTVGFQITERFEVNLKNDRVRNRLTEIGEVRGKRYAEFYYRVMRSAKLTYALAAMTISALLAALTGTVSTLVYGVIIAALLVSHVDGKVNDELKARREALISELPQMLSKLALLVNSGMVIRDAWRKIAKAGTGELYREMRVTVLDIDNGISEFIAYRDFGDRCAIKEAKRFTSTMIQNLQKQNSEVAYLLREMADEMWDTKKNLAKQKGASVNSQLMIPTAIIFTGIMILVMVPAFLNLNF